MIKFVVVLERREDITLKDFHDYWLNAHAPKVVARASTLRARRYVQSHLIDTPHNEYMRAARGMPAPVAGITEVWWDSIADFEAVWSSPEGSAALAELAEDEATFIDIPRSQLFVTKENTVYDITGGAKFGPDAAKLTFLLSRPAELTADACHHTWLVDHGPLACSFARDLPVVRYVQSHAIAPELNRSLAAFRGASEACDGLTELWVRSMADWDAACATEAAQRALATLAEDERRFVDMSRSRSFFTKEHEIFDYV